MGKPGGQAQSNRAPHLLGNALVTMILWFGAISMMVPFIWMVTTSLKPLPDVFKWPPIAFSSPPVWRNYLEIFDAVPLARYFINTVFVTGVKTTGVVVVSTLAGFTFARLRFPGRNTLFLIYLGTMMVPGEVTLVPLFILMRELDWINSYWALIVPGIFAPFGVFLMRQAFLTIPQDLSDAARLDGATPFGILSDIMVPLVKPAIVTLTIFTAMGAWNDFLWPLIVINSSQRQLISVGLASFQDLYFTDWPKMMAAAVVAMVPILVLYFVSQKYFVEGIAVTGLKG